MKNNLLKPGFLAACNLVFTSQFVAATANAETTSQDNSKPNVLVILVDDWGGSDLSCKGSKFYETPNVDALASTSTDFTQGYVAYPRSVPSRYSIMTGLNCARPQNGEKGTEMDERKVLKNSYVIAEPFQQAGYNTFFMGKWHLTNDECLPQDKGFDINIGGGHAGATSSHFAPFNQNFDPKNSSAEGGLIEGMDDAAPGEYLTDYMNRKMVSYIEAEHKKPFFAICSYYAVHTPLQAKADMVAKYKAKKEKLGLTEDKYVKEEAGDRKAVQNHEVYAAMIESVDQGVGQMISALKRTGQYDNTIIVLISDNGGLSNRGNNREVATCNDPFKAGKGHLYEGGIHVPYFIHMPGQTKGVKCDVPAVSYDLFPTLTDLCNVPLKANALLDGVSLKPLVTNTTASDKVLHRDLYWHKAAERPTSTGDYVSTAIRSGNFKLIDFYQQNRLELYDLSQDVSETHNLINEKPELADTLLKKIKAWRQEMHVTMAKPKKEKVQKNDKTSDN